MPPEVAAQTAAPRAAARSAGWLVNKLAVLGFATPTPIHWRNRPRRVDVLLGGRPAALLMKPTTPLFARK